MAVYRWEVLCRVQKYPLNDLPRSAVNAPYGQSGGFRLAYRDVPIISCATFYDREQRDPGEAFENRRDRQNARLTLIFSRGRPGQSATATRSLGVTIPAGRL